MADIKTNLRELGVVYSLKYLCEREEPTISVSPAKFIRHRRKYKFPLLNFLLFVYNNIVDFCIIAFVRRLKTCCI